MKLFERSSFLIEDTPVGVEDGLCALRVDAAIDENAIANFQSLWTVSKEPVVMEYASDLFYTPAEISTCDYTAVQ